jgi:glycosyltransferase involved in cell wall biosynthesis
MQPADAIADLPSNQIRVSIVMPVFNAARFFAASVGSVIEQSMEDWELILVDDESSDESPHLCREYADTFPNIHFISQKNAGPAAARNAGVRLAQGDFLFFLDADDRIPPDALELLLSEAEIQQADMVLGNFLKQENDGPEQLQPAVLSLDGKVFDGERKTLDAQALLDYVRHFLNNPSNHLVSYCWARLYRMSVIREHGLQANENMRLFEDFAFNLAFLGICRRLVFLNRPVYVYILRSAHVSASMSILNASSLTSDMQAFRNTTEHFMAEIGVHEKLAYDVRREVRHTLVHYALIFIIRTCRQLNAGTRNQIINELRKFVSAPILRESLPCYRPRPGNSRLLPLLIKLKFVRLLAVVAKHKGNQRYGKLKNKTT